MNGQASDDGVPQFSPAIAVRPVCTVTGWPTARLAAMQPAVSGSTETTAVPGAAVRLR
jgi:hypothetical protein